MSPFYGIVLVSGVLSVQTVYVRPDHMLLFLCIIDDDINFYYQECDMSSMLPPENEWLIGEHGFEPSPRITPQRNDELKVIVDGCGVEQLNGTYRQVDIRHNIPHYSKKGLWNGREVHFTLHHRALGTDFNWYLSINGAQDLYMSSDRACLPPQVGWYAVNANTLQHLPPKITQE